MRKGFAILFSLALALSQPTGIIAAPEKLAACCGCDEKDCCVNTSDKPSAETPAIPTANSLQKHFQTIVWLAVRTLSPPTTSDNQATSSNVALPFAHPVPLFTRDCAYLI